MGEKRLQVQCRQAGNLGKVGDVMWWRGGGRRGRVPELAQLVSMTDMGRRGSADQSLCQTGTHPQTFFCPLVQGCLSYLPLTTTLGKSKVRACPFRIQPFCSLLLSLFLLWAHLLSFVQITA